MRRLSVAQKEYAEDRSPGLIKLKRTAEVLLKLRLAIMRLDYSIAEKVMREILDLGRLGILHKAVLAEADAISNSLHDHKVKSVLSKALAAGQASGVIGERDLSTLSTSELDIGIELVYSIADRTEHSELLLMSAMAIREIRVAWKRGDYDGMKYAIEIIEQRGIAIEARPEIESARQEIENAEIVSLLEGALRTETSGPEESEQKEY